MGKKHVVREGEFRDQWPFTFSTGTIRNIAGAVIITDSNTGKHYALTYFGSLNDKGKDKTNVCHRVIRKVDLVWKDNPRPGFEGSKIPLTPFIKIGLSLDSA